MTLAVRVEGGTRAGTRVVREPARDWVHVCAVQLRSDTPKGRLLAACYTRCPFCGCKRPSS